MWHRSRCIRFNMLPTGFCQDMFGHIRNFFQIGVYRVICVKQKLNKKDVHRRMNVVSLVAGMWSCS